MRLLFNSFIKLNEIPNPQQIWICFHYVGGSANAYYPWRLKIPENIQLYALQLPGREGRQNEPFLRNFQDIIDIYFNLLLKLDLKCPFIFFGHSMGALIAYELMAKLEQLPHLQEHQLVISACKAPHFIVPAKRSKDYNDKDLIEELASYGGTPHVILNDKQLLNNFLPRLRADMEVLESYYCESRMRLKCPINAFGGSEDRFVPVDAISEWSNYTQSSFQKKIFPGGHFFLNGMLDEFVQEIYQLTRISIG